MSSFDDWDRLNSAHGTDSLPWVLDIFCEPPWSSVGRDYVAYTAQKSLYRIVAKLFESSQKDFEKRSETLLLVLGRGLRRSIKKCTDKCSKGNGATNSNPSAPPSPPSENGIATRTKKENAKVIERWMFFFCQSLAHAPLSSKHLYMALFVEHFDQVRSACARAFASAGHDDEGVLFAWLLVRTMRLCCVFFRDRQVESREENGGRADSSDGTGDEYNGHDCVNGGHVDEGSGPMDVCGFQDLVLSTLEDGSWILQPLRTATWTREWTPADHMRISLISELLELCIALISLCLETTRAPLQKRSVEILGVVIPVIDATTVSALSASRACGIAVEGRESETKDSGLAKDARKEERGEEARREGEGAAFATTVSGSDQCLHARVSTVIRLSCIAALEAALLCAITITRFPSLSVSLAQSSSPVLDFRKNGRMEVQVAALMTGCFKRCWLFARISGNKCAADAADAILSVMCGQDDHAVRFLLLLTKLEAILLHAEAHASASASGSGTIGSIAHTPATTALATNADAATAELARATDAFNAPVVGPTLHAVLQSFGLAKCGPFASFCTCLNYDMSVLLDFLLSDETDFLEFTLRFAKLLRRYPPDATGDTGGGASESAGVGMMAAMGTVIKTMIEGQGKEGAHEPARIELEAGTEMVMEKGEEQSAKEGQVAPKDRKRKRMRNQQDELGAKVEQWANRNDIVREALASLRKSVASLSRRGLVCFSTSVLLNALDEALYAMEPTTDSLAKKEEGSKDVTART